MKDDGQIDADIRMIVDNLEDRTILRIVSLWSLYAVVPLGVLAIGLGILGETHLLASLVSLTAGLSVAFLVVGLTGFGMVSRVARLAADRYEAQFPRHTTNRRLANQTLSGLAKDSFWAHHLKTQLDQKLYEEEQERARQKKAEQQERKKLENERRVEIARNTYKVCPSFECGECRHPVTIEKAYLHTVTCDVCHSSLRVPEHPPCPSCGSHVTAFHLTETEHSNKGKLAGAMLGGLGGLIVGAVFDEVVGQVKTAVSSKSPTRYLCHDCGHEWAIAFRARFRAR
jgi:hypothetical protein